MFLLMILLLMFFDPTHNRIFLFIFALILLQFYYDIIVLQYIL